MVISAAGDRRDQDITEQGRLVGGFFDHIILYEDACQRGRPDGETLALLQQGIALASGNKKPSVVEVRGEFKGHSNGAGRNRPRPLGVGLDRPGQ